MALVETGGFPVAAGFLGEATSFHSSEPLGIPLWWKGGRNVETGPHDTCIALCGLQRLGFSDAEGMLPPSKWLKDWPVPTLADNPQSTAAQAFGLNAWPFFVFVTADGRVDFRFPGELAPETLVEAARTLAGG